MIKMTGATATDVGQVREINQDRVFLSKTIAAVADGMGGHAGGEVASALAIAQISGIRTTVSVEAFHNIIEGANRRIYEAAIKPDLRGMGTTLVAATLDAERNVVHILNVGDSRAYLVRDGAISQITVDHSLVEDLVRQGSIDPEDTRSHPQRNIVTRALGISDNVMVDTFEVEAHSGDRIILCSDGLSNELNDADIAALTAEADTAADAADELVSAAVQAGGKDNVSVAVLILTTDGESPGGGLDFAGLDESDGLEFSGPPTEVGIEPVRVKASTTNVGPPEATKSRSFPWRGALLAALVAAILGVAVFATSWYATSAWFVDEQAGEVVIFRGRPGGLLFWDPTVEEATGIASDELDGASTERVKARTVWSSLDEAQELVDLLVVVEPTASEG